LEVRVSPTEQLGFFDETIFPVQHKLDGASFPVPAGPGLGVEVDEAYVARQEFKFAEAPHLHKRDGSYTNW
jgi:galactonate dehydratase